MFLTRVLKVRYLAVLLLVLIVAASAYAFAAANVVPESGAGDGQDDDQWLHDHRCHLHAEHDQPGQHRCRQVRHHSDRRRTGTSDW